MNIFIVLVKKELRELLTPLIFVPLIITVLMFGSIGKISEKQTKKAAASPIQITVVDLDQSTTSKLLIDSFTVAHFIIHTEHSAAAGLATAKSSHDGEMIVVPEGFGTALNNHDPKPLQVTTLLRSFSAFGARDDSALSAVIQQVNTAIGNQLLAQESAIDPNIVRNPIRVTNYVYVNDQSAQTTLAAIMNQIQSQTYFIPLILFIVIVFAAQMIATSIATEKENKTLETLLSAPVPRQTIVTAKLLSAGLIALLFAGVYMIGMRYYLQGLTGGALSGGGGSITQIISQLGLTFTPTSLVLLGASLFLAILCALALALILGAFAEDVKSIQSLIMPLMVLTIIPYLLITLFDITTFSTPMRWLLYAIPFSHPFLAIQLLLLHQYTPVIYGIAYELVIFGILVAIAARIFSTDAIVTLKLNFGKRKLFQ